jgi:hypothetical protein
MGERISAYRAMVSRPEGKRPLGREVASACECGNEPSGSIKFGEFLD